MPRHAAYVVLVVIVVALAAVDLFILTSSAAVTRITKQELKRIFGEDLSYEKLTASLDGTLGFRDVRFRIPKTEIEVMESETAVLQIASTPLGRHVKSVILKGARFTMNDRAIDELSKGTDGRSLGEVMEPGTLPRVECTDGTFALHLGEIVRGEEPVSFQIDTLVMLPIGDYGFLVTGRVRHDILGRWTIGGEMNLDTGEVRLVYSTDELVLSDQVYALLSDDVRRHWDNWKPEGRVGVYVRMESDGRSDLVVVPTITMIDLNIRYGNFPYPIEHATGEIDFLTEGFVVKYLKGEHNGMIARASGQSDGYEADAGFQVRVDIENMALDDDLFNAMGEEERGILKLFSPTGRVSAHLIVEREHGDDKKVNTPLQISLNDASFAYKDFPYTLRNVEGWLAVERDKITIRGMKAKDQGADFHIEGTILSIAKNPEIDLRIRARNLPMDDRLFAAVPEGTQKVWKDLSPSGVLDLDWHVRKKPGEKEIHHGMIHSRAKGNQCTYAKVPVPISDVEGLVEYTMERTILHHLSGTGAGAKIVLHGEIDHDGPVTLKFDTVGFKIDEKVSANFPKSVRKILDKVGLSGDSNFKLDLTIGEKLIDYALDLRLHNAVINAALPFENVQGTVSLTGTIEGERNDILGHINFARAKVEGKTLSDVLASLNSSDSTLRFGSIKASAYGGVITGSFFVNMETGEYGGAFAGDRISLREYTRETEGFKDKAILGRVSFELNDLTGKGKDLNTLSAKGSLLLRDGFLWDIPLFVSLWTANPQQVFSKKNAFDAGNVTFRIKKHKFYVDEVAFTSTDVSVVGHGKVDFDGKLDVVLRASSGSLLGVKIPGLDILLSPLDLLRSAFLGVRVTGTFEKPESTLEMFPGIGNDDE